MKRKNNLFGKMYSLALVFFMLLNLLTLNAFSKEKINVYFYTDKPEFFNTVIYHVDRYKKSNILSLFDVNIYQLESIKDFNFVLSNSDIDILIAPVNLLYVISKYKTIRPWDEYFNKSPTFFAVFKTYTVDFMKNICQSNSGNILFLPFFAYSLYYDKAFPSVEKLSLVELLSFYNSLIYSVDYIALYKYLRNVKVEGKLYSCKGNIDLEDAKLFSLKEGFMNVDPPVVLYGIFLLSYPSNVSKQRAIDFIATKIWDFETQIDLCLSYGVLGADKNTSLHPDYIKLSKNKKFSLFYNKNLSNLKDFNIDYNFALNINDIITSNQDPQSVISFINSYLYSLNTNVEFLYSSYQKLLKRNKFKDYLIVIFNKNKVERLVYTPNFNKSSLKIQNVNKTFYDLAIDVFKDDKKLKASLIDQKKDPKSFIQDYKVISSDEKFDDLTILLQKQAQKEKKDDKKRLLILKRKSNNDFSIVIVSSD